MIAQVHGDVIEALTQALEYFEDREDVMDGSYGEPSPNREMSLAQLCRDALGHVSLGRPLKDCDDLDGYAIRQLTEALERHGYRVQKRRKPKGSLSRSQERQP